MTAVVYPKTLEAMWDGGAGAVAGTVKVVAVDTAVYTYSDAHEFLADLSGIRSDAVTVAGKAFTDGLFTAASVSLTGVALGETIGAIVTYVDTGVAGTSRLLTFDDTQSNGTDIDLDGDNTIIVVTWPTYVGRI